MASYNDLMNQAAQQYGIPTSWLTTIISNENSSQQYNPTSPTQVQGFAQITGGTWATNFPGVPYSTNPVDQINAAAQILEKYYNQYDGDFSLAAAAYNGGPEVANKAQALIDSGVSESDAIAQASAQVYPNNPAKQAEIINYVNKANDPNNPNRNYGSTATGNPDPRTAMTEIPVAGSTISPSQIAAVALTINPQPFTENGVKDVVSWYSDNQIINNNRSHASPVTFGVSFSKDGNSLPILIKLKASLQGFSKSMKHITNIVPSRTATVAYLWGMQADTITGKGNTGLFMNQLGMSDYLSVSNLSSTMKQAILQGMSNRVLFNGTKGTSITTPNAQGTLPSAVNITPDGMRMAAKDAFMELLALFRSNATVWINGKQQGDPTTNQVGADAWSTVTGSTSYQINASNNDVWSRGAVSLHFRNYTYYGFFKSLTWTLDASKPFSWDFNFVFQVTKTVSNSYYQSLNAQ